MTREEIRQIARGRMMRWATLVERYAVLPLIMIVTESPDQPPGLRMISDEDMTPQEAAAVFLKASHDIRAGRYNRQ